jgi:hypothetical protein
MQDRNRLTWITYENFENMYTNVYKAMVKARVAIKLDAEFMFDCAGNVTGDCNEMFGRIAKCKVNCPKRCVYVEATGCNTNMKEDGHIGGRQYVMAADQVEGARNGDTNNLHFTVLDFTSGADEEIMCVVVVADIPISWKLGLDVTKDIMKGQTV